ncbi:helix-turn-helix domain-containing protein, partial [Geobacillus stearothermophilus]
MDESMGHDIALLRYGLIAPFVNGQVEPKTYLKEVSELVHHVPHQGDKRIEAKTIHDWCTRYKKRGFDALKPKPRSDRGQPRHTSPDDEDHIIKFRKKNPTIPEHTFTKQ